MLLSHASMIRKSQQVGPLKFKQFPWESVSTISRYSIREKKRKMLQVTSALKTCVDQESRSVSLTFVKKASGDVLLANRRMNRMLKRVPGAETRRKF